MQSKYKSLCTTLSQQAASVDAPAAERKALLLERNQLLSNFQLLEQQLQDAQSASSALSANLDQAQTDRDSLLTELQAVKDKSQQDTQAQAELLRDFEALTHRAQQDSELQVKHDSLLRELSTVQQRAKQDSQHASSLLQSFAQQRDDAVANSISLQQQVAMLNAGTAKPTPVQAELDDAISYIAELKHRLSVYSSFYSPPWVKDLQSQHGMGHFAWLHHQSNSWKSDAAPQEQMQHDGRAQVRTDVRDLEQQLAAMTAETAQHQKQREASTAQVAGLQQQLAAMSSERAQQQELQKQYKASTAQIATLQQQLAAMGSRTAEHQELKNWYEASTAQVADLQQQLGAMKTDLQWRCSELSSGAAQHELLTGQHEALQLQHQELQTQHKALQVTQV